MGFIVTLSIILGVWCLWVRRWAWHRPWYAAATLNVALQTFGVLLVSGPVSRWVSPKLHLITGRWNVEDLIGHVSYLTGMFAVLYMLASRLDMSDAQFGWFVRNRVMIPAVTAISATCGVFAAGDIGDRYVPDLTAAKTTPWLHAYWLVMTVACSYLIWHLCGALIALRRDQEQKRSATAYLVAVAVSAACTVAFVLSIEPLQWVLVRCELIAYAIAASYSWRRRLAQLRGR